MSYDTWDWSLAGGSGKTFSNFVAERFDPLLRIESEAGYVQTSPVNNRGVWIFKFDFEIILPSNYIYIVNFYHAHRGGIPFYASWPVGLADIPDKIDEADPGSIEPWDSELVPGAGEGPYHLFFWNQDSFAVKRLKGPENYWQSSGTIEWRQI